MKRKIFIAIQLPEEIKEKLFSLKNGFSGIPVKLIEKNNIHITLNFIGYVKENEVEEIKINIGKAINHINSFNLRITDISCADTESKIPKMIWANIEESDEIIHLQKILEKNTGIKFFPHITLAQINAWEFKKIEPGELPDINLELDLNFKVESIDLMESKISRGKVKYKLLEKFKLNK